MPRVIVYIQDNQNGGPTFWLDLPTNLKDARKGYPVTVSSVEPPFTHMRDDLPYDEVVKAAGEALYEMLATQPAVDQALKNALADENQTNAVCFFLDPPDADALPWEALHDSVKGFLALRNAWPIARLRKSNLELDVENTFAPPLKILGVISAAGASAATRVPGVREWESLIGNGADRLDAGGLPVQLRVLVGEEELKNTIDQTKAAQNLNWLSTDWVVDRDQVFSAIRDFSPHILHFFCHGTTEYSPHLQIGSRSDWQAGLDGSIPVTADELRARADPRRTVWLITLNACESATQTKDARGLANDMVVQGFPAAIGMRENTDASHAHKFCRLFYRAVVKTVAALPEGGAAQEIEWAALMYEARTELGGVCQPGIPLQTAACACKHWTIPALYSRPEPFKLRRLVPKAALTLREKQKLLAERKELVRQRSELQGDRETPPQIVAGILKDFDDKIEQIDVTLTSEP